MGIHIVDPYYWQSIISDTYAIALWVPIFSHTRSLKRIGPHNYDILTIIYGSLLGDAQAEKGIIGSDTKITFFQEGSHIKYVLFLHKLFSDLGYCNSNIPTITTRLGGKGKILKVVRFST